MILKTPNETFLRITRSIRYFCIKSNQIKQYIIPYFHETTHLKSRLPQLACCQSVSAAEENLSGKLIFRQVDLHIDRFWHRSVCTLKYLHTNRITWWQNYIANWQTPSYSHFLLPLDTFRAINLRWPKVLGFYTQTINFSKKYKKWIVSKIIHVLLSRKYLLFLSIGNPKNTWCFVSLFQQKSRIFVFWCHFLNRLS